MTTLTDFLTLQDGAKRINGSPNAINIGFNLPEDFVQGTNLAKPVLQFKIFVHQPTKLEVWVNGFPNVQLDESLKEHHYLRTLHEFIDGSKFKPGKRNEIKFILMDTSIFDDTMNDVRSISDILLIYQRKVKA